jgi:hypothetical protein
MMMIMVVVIHRSVKHIGMQKKLDDKHHYNTTLTRRHGDVVKEIHKQYQKTNWTWAILNDKTLSHILGRIIQFFTVKRNNYQ